MDSKYSFHNALLLNLIIYTFSQDYKKENKQKNLIELKFFFIHLGMMSTNGTKNNTQCQCLIL